MALFALPGTSARERIRLDSDWKFSLGKLENPMLESAGLISDWEYVILGASVDKRRLSIPAEGFVKKRVPCGDVFGGKPGFAWFKATVALPKPAEGEFCALYF